MCKKLAFLVCVIVVLGLVGKAPADEYNWVGGTDNDNWCHEDNWLPSGGPPDGPDDQAGNGDTPPQQGPKIGPGCDANVGSISLPSGEVDQVMDITGGTLICHGDWRWSDGDDSNGTVTISGGDVNVHGWFRWADKTGGYGIANFTGGTFNCTSGIKVGDDGGGEMHVSGSETELHLGSLEFNVRESTSTMLFNMSGRLIDIDGGWDMGGGDTSPNAITINFDAGTIICNDFGMADDDGNTIPFSMDFEEGTLLDIGQDRLARIQEYIAAGYITGQDDTVEPSVVLVEGHTLVGFDLVQKEASGPSPTSGTGNLCPDSVTISWTPGAYCVDDHNVYFGTSWDDVNESTTANWPHNVANSITFTDLEVGTAYFWRVDEVNDNDANSPWKGSVWQFSTEGGAASDPSPYRRGLKAEDVDSLSWSTHCIADAHNVYFATDLPASIVLFEDDFEPGVFGPNWTATGSWEIFDANGDPNFGGRDANMAKATGSGDLTIAVNVDATEGDPCAMNISFYFRKTEEITNGEIKLYYGYGGNWDYIADLNSNPEGVNDVWLHYSDTNSNSKYFVSTFKIKLEANITGGTVYIDDVTITNTWPTDAQWYETRVDVNSHPISVEPMTVYRWRVDTVIDGNVYQGPHWKFSTGYGGLLMYYRFDGTNPFPSPIQDDSDNDIEFYKYTDGGGSVTYGESNPVLAGSTASAEFDPNAGLYRLDPCGPSEDTRDILRLDGDYTVEMWVMPRNLTEEEDVYVISKRGSWGLMIKTENDWEFRWQGGGGDTGSDSVENDKWYHVAVVSDQTDEDLSGMYLNGDRKGDAGGLLPPDNNSPIWIGCRVLADGNLGNFFDGMIDEIRIHDIALRPCELLVFQVAPEYAICPIPYDGEGEVDPCTVELIWTPGEGMVHQELYFSSDYDDVIGAGATPVETTYSLSSWTPPSTLGDGTIYYWRVDSYDGSNWYRPTEAWRFTTVYVIEDPALFLWYKFDEISGDDVIDASGHGYHGDVDDLEADTWDPCDGKFYPGCISMHEEERIDLPDLVLDHIGTEITISVWWKEAWRTGDDSWFCGFGDDDIHMAVRAPDSLGEGIQWHAGDDTNDILIWETDPKAWMDKWHHLVFTKNEAEGTMKIYFDATVVASSDDANSGTLAEAATRARGEDGFRIGTQWDHDDDFVGKADDFRLYDYELSQNQINELFRGGDLCIAWGQSPYDGQQDALPDANLVWKPGDWASSHEVYFGTSKQDVEDANNSWPVGTSVYKGKQGPNTYDPCLLTLDQTYYWRIDEVNDTNDKRCRGNLWRFKVAEYIVIDDMEDYTPLGQPGDIFSGWADGATNSSNSYLFLQATAPVHGEQSMKYHYDNIMNWGVGYYAEIETKGGNLDPNNWAVFDGRTLSLWFYGKAGNDANDTEQMYVGLEDNDGNHAEVRYPMADMDDIRVEEWQLWEMFLSDFTNVNLAKLEKLFIGFGTRGGLFPGGNGDVHFDDIRVYPPYCVPEEGPKADLSGNCIVDFADIEIMARDWLEADVNLGEVVKPDANGLVGWWKFDEAAADTNIATDYSDYDNNGVIETLNANVWWVAAGHDGNALEFDGGVVEIADDGNTPELRPERKVTACAWINRAHSVDNEEKVVVKGRNDWETYALEVSDENLARFLVRDANDVDNQYTVDSPNELPVDSWVHVAGTYDGNELTVYVNGQVAANSVHPLWEKLAADANDGFTIAGRWGDDTGRFTGTIDDVRVYNYALSLEEVRYITTDTTGILALESIADLYKEPLGKGAINLKDFAELAKDWLKKQLWPP